MTCHVVHYEYFLIFTADDPRRDGCMERIEDDIWLDDAHLTGPAAIDVPSGLCAGRNPVDETHYHLFRSPADRSRAGFHQVVGVPVVVPSWNAFLEAAADCGEPLGSRMGW